MSTIVTRAGKGSPLTNNEVDANFTNLNTDKIQVTGTPTTGQAVTWNGTAWVPSTITAGVSSVASADGSVTVVNTSGAVDLSVAVAASANNVVCQVRNTTGATLTKGTVVYISGATGQIPTVSKALATSDATSAQTLGMMTADLPNNTNGNVTIIGLITNIDTSAYTDGAQLYLSGTTAGTVTTTKPYAPIHLVYVGVVEHAHPTQGKIFVKVQNGYELDEIHNVSAQSPTNGQTIVYNSATSLWEAKTLDSLPSQTGNSGKYLTTNGTVASWATVSGGGTNSYTRTTFTATAGQTTFTVAYTVGYAEVFLNGVLLYSADYTATSGTSIVLATGATVGDIVDVIAYSTNAVGTVSGSNITGNIPVTNLNSGTAASSSTYWRGDGTWATVSSLPSQTGNTGKYLTTDGTNPSWATVVTGGGPITQNADSVSTNQTIAAGSNGFSVGPITIASGYSVTIASGQRWVII